MRLGRLASKRGFYLAGGTALALQLGHRRSVDFVWFCEGPLGDVLRLARALRYFGKKYGARDASHVLYALTYFDDAEREPMPRMLEPWAWPDIKLDIQRRVRALTR